ncbi:MAG: TerC/Alx family metal homeostasis membrane protein [Bacteroidales bacterium]|nr:TerC/Alx family metal homeostasis membrane protein [Bacteroidales bacterium]
MNTQELLFFGAYLLFVILMLSIDLGVFNRNAHVVGMKEALWMSIFWVGLGVSFYYFFRHFGHLVHGLDNLDEIQSRITYYRHPISIAGLSFEEARDLYNKNLSLEYITSYLIEKALSVDNIFVMILIFKGFGIGNKYFHRVLFWGILGAVIMRFIFIFLGAALIHEFVWVLYIFGVFLLYSGAKIFFQKNEEQIETHNHPIVKFASKHFRLAADYVGQKFIIKKDSKYYLTPLFLVLLVIEFSDVVFAMDSIPAIFSITLDPYIVFFSNIFAILGLRALFFLVSNIMELFRFLQYGLGVLLSFIGLKLLFHEFLYEKLGIGTVESLYAILLILGVSIIASLVFPEKKEELDV